MYVDYHETEIPSTNSPLHVYKIFRLLADHTYQIHHAPLQQDHLVFVYTDQGSGKLLCAEGAFLLEADSALIFSADTPFFYHTEGSHWHFWWFEFVGNIPAAKGHLYTLNKSDLLDTICKNALKSLRTKSPNTASYLSCLLSLCEDSDQSHRKHEQELLDHAYAIVKKQLYRTNISDLARELFVDPRTLYNLFKHYNGCSPKTYIRNYVMDMAGYLLRNTTKSIGEISNETGFANQFHFSRVFKETYGISPRAYRQNSKNLS